MNYYTIIALTIVRSEVYILYVGLPERCYISPYSL